MARVDSNVAGAKRELRRSLLAARARRSAPEVKAAGLAIAEGVVDLAERAAPETSRRPEGGPAAGTVAAFCSVGTEPPTGPSINALIEYGYRVLLPIQLPDRDLDWGEFVGWDSLEVGPHGISQPRRALGKDEIRSAGVILVPALAVTSDGRRLGRGGGSYDRALSRLLRSSGTRSAAASCAVVYVEEVLHTVPTEPHDQRVDWLMTPTRCERTSALTGP